MKMGTVLRDVRTIAHQGLPVDIRIAGRIIAAVSPSPILPRPGDEIIDGGGKLAVPGLVNAHGHAPMTLLRGIADDVPLQTWLEQAIWPTEAKMTEDDVYWGTLLAQAEMLRSGTTQFADMYFHVDAIARAVAEGGLRALLSYGMIADRLDRHGRSEIDRTEHLLRTWHGEENDRIRIAVAPHAIYTCGEEIWREAVAVASRYNVPIHTHVCETKKEVDDWRSSHGRSPIAELQRWGVFSVPTLAAHCVHVEAEDIHWLAKNNVTVVHCPASNAKLGSGIAPLGMFSRHDVSVAIGTDGAASNNNLDMLRELRLAVLLQKASRQDPTAMSAEDAFKLATQNGAAACGTNAGALEVGTLADLVLIDLDRCPTMPVHRPLSAVVYASDPASVTDVYVDGQPLLRNGELLTLDEEKIRAEVRRIGSRLVG
ncbi:amidohydrolase [Candidatus Bipolaricaulota bacterium]|nr:amidohydrolase [Candidatus Bipolaricaulota bacterium]